VTREITRSGRYWVFVHYSRAVRPGARRFDSQRKLAGVGHVAFANPDGSIAVVIANPAGKASTSLRMAAREALIDLPEDSITTLIWR